MIIISIFGTSPWLVLLILFVKYARTHAPMPTGLLVVHEANFRALVHPAYFLYFADSAITEIAESAKYKKYAGFKWAKDPAVFKNAKLQVNAGSRALS